MIDTTQTNYLLADTRLEITNTNPAPGLLGISRDTSSLFVSDGTRWIETNINSKHNIEHQVTANDTISQSPMLHFDVSDSNTIETFSGRTVQDGQSVNRFNSLVSNEALLSTPTMAGVYVENDLNGNSGIVMTGKQGMEPDLDIAQTRDGAFTVLCVYTPTPDILSSGVGLERQWSPPNDVEEGEASTYGTNRYSMAPIGTSYLFSTHLYNNESNSAGHYIRMHQSNSSTYLYAREDNGISITFPQSYQTSSSDTNVTSGNINGENLLVPGVTRSDNGLTGNRIHHWNQNYVGKPQIISYRVESNKESPTPSMLKATLHTWYPTLLDTTYTWNIYSGASVKYSSVPYHGISLGTIGSTYGHNLYSPNCTYHEMMVFDKYITDKDLDTIGTHLASKWDTGGATDTWRI